MAHGDLPETATDVDIGDRGEVLEGPGVVGRRFRIYQGLGVGGSETSPDTELNDLTAYKVQKT